MMKQLQEVQYAGDTAAITTDADDVVASASGTANTAMTLNTSGKATTSDPDGIVDGFNASVMVQMR